MTLTPESHYPGRKAAQRTDSVVAESKTTASYATPGKQTSCFCCFPSGHNCQGALQTKKERTSSGYTILATI